MLTTDPRHGTPAGYDAHRRDDEEPCANCRAAAAAYEYRRRIDSILGRPYTVPSIGTARRVQALVALGWTFGQIGQQLGRGHDYAQKLATRADTFVRHSTAELVADVYEQMSMSLPPRETGRDRWRANYAQTAAAKRGWVPPLCWNDIDDADEQPTGLRAANTRRDLLTEWAELEAAGESIGQAALRLGVTVGAIERAEFRARKRIA